MTARTWLGPLLAAGVLAWPSAAHGWGSAEHQVIGSSAYLRACAEIAADIAARGVVAPAVAARMDIACGRDRETQADIYGIATALAGDHLNEPSEFFSQAGAWRFKNRRSYWLLALENSEHFNPMATQSWARYHQMAISEALAAATASGLESVAHFQLATQESAFADHFLQDAFAAGHMGFNRTASSASAAKSFHDTWNKRGRIVSDRNGDRWVTFGDGELGKPRSEEARRHVIDASTLSVRNVMRAFVLGERSPQEEMAAWRALPFTIQAPEMNVDIVEIFERPDAAADRKLIPLVTTVRPARKDTVLTGTVWSAVPFSDADQYVMAAVGGFELALPRIPAQSYLGAGGTVREPGGTHSLVAETGVVFDIGVGLRTLVSHQLNATASWLIRNGVATVLHAEYQLNAELGDVLVSLRGGIAELLPNPRTGWYAAAGLGLTFSAAGGGAF
jgi:hypothetical protein